MDLGQVKLICAALVAELLAAAAVCGGLTFAGVVPTTSALIPPMAGFVALAFPASVLLGIAVRSSMLQRARLSWLREDGTDAQASIDQFEDAYARASLVQAATLNGFGLLGAVSALVTGILLFFAAPAVAIIGIGLVYPTEPKFRMLTDRLTRPADNRELRQLAALRERRS